jgi:uncharacterized protein
VISLKWSIYQLNKLQNKGLTIDETIDLSELKEVDPAIRDISLVHVSGRADLSSTKATFHLTIDGHMILPCSRTLVDVKYPFHIQTTETMLFNTDEHETDDENVHPIQGETVDLLPVIKEIILLEVPMQVFSENADENALTSGQGWEVITEKEKKDQIDPRLAGLAKFFEQKNE